MKRFHHFFENAGRGGCFRLVFVGLVFAAMAFHFQGMVMLSWSLGLGLGAVCGLWMAGEPEARGGLHRVLGIALVVSSLLLGHFRDSLGIADEVLATGLSGVVAFYLSSYFFFLSDRRVVRLPQDV